MRLTYENKAFTYLLTYLTCMWQTKDEMKCENVNWKMWWYQEDFECIMKLTGINYSDTLYDKHKIKTSWADERIDDEGYGMNNEWQTGRIKVPRSQSSREKVG